MFQIKHIFPKCDYWHTCSEHGSQDLLVDSSRVLRRTNVHVQQLSEVFFFFTDTLGFFFNSTFKRKVWPSKMGFFFSYFLIWGAIPHRLLWWQSQFKRWQPCFMLLLCCKKKAPTCWFLGLCFWPEQWNEWSFKKKPRGLFLPFNHICDPF